MCYLPEKNCKTITRASIATTPAMSQGQLPFPFSVIFNPFLFWTITLLYNLQIRKTIPQRT